MAGRFSITNVRPFKRLAAAIAVSAVLLPLTAWVALSLRGRNSRRTSQTHGPAITAAESQDWAALDPAALRPAEVRPAILCDYYEHNIEHAPPRDPSGCMQRRENTYTAPLEPVRLLHSKIGQQSANVELFRFTQKWKAAWTEGRQLPQPQLEGWESCARRSTCSGADLLDVGRSFVFLGDASVGALWFRAGLSKAEQEYSGKSAGDPEVAPLLALLDQTRALWQLKDYPALEKRFAIAMRLNAPLTAEARRAGYLHAEMLYYQGKYTESAAAMAAVQRDHDRAGDLGAREASDIPEMHWVLGMMLYDVPRLEEAIYHLRIVADSPGDHRKEASVLLVGALAKLGRAEEANDRFNDYVRAYRPAAADVTFLVALIEQAERRRVPLSGTEPPPGP